MLKVNNISPTVNTLPTDPSAGILDSDLPARRRTGNYAFDAVLYRA